MNLETTKPARTEKVRRTFKLSVLVDRATKEFSPGMGVGVLATGEVTFNLPAKDYESAIFALCLRDHQEKLRDEVIKLGIEEVFPAAKRGARKTATRKTDARKAPKAPA